jgi:hypothetical protein
LCRRAPPEAVDRSRFPTVGEMRGVDGELPDPPRDVRLSASSLAQTKMPQDARDRVGVDDGVAEEFTCVAVSGGHALTVWGAADSLSRCSVNDQIAAGMSMRYRVS